MDVSGCSGTGEDSLGAIPLEEDNEEDEEEVKLPHEPNQGAWRSQDSQRERTSPEPQKTHFSMEPIQVFNTYSNEDDHHCNKDVDPMVASAEYIWRSRWRGWSCILWNGRTPRAWVSALLAWGMDRHGPGEGGHVHQDRD